MSLPKVIRNNFITRKHAVCLDNLSKAYIMFELLVGVNRFSLFGTKSSYVFATLLLYTFFLSACLVIYLILVTPKMNILEVLMISFKASQYILFVVIGMVFWRRIQRYYEELEKFDVEVGCKTKAALSSKLVMIQMGILSFVCVYMTSYIGHIQFAPVHILYVTETHYFAHLITLLGPKIRLISCYLETALMDENLKMGKKSKTCEFVPIKKNSSHRIKMDDIMDLYRFIINAHDYLVDAIKWQMMIIIITSFALVLVELYNCALHIILDENLMKILPLYGMVTSTELLSLLAPCVCADRARGELRRLRDLLASTLFDGKLDKNSRRVARALLALTDAHNLPFSLMRMVDISITLLFSFVGLLLTYLIILLQFQKIINPL